MSFKKTSLMEIGILGAGWLGTVLAKKGIENNHNVVVSSTNKKKIKILKNKGYKAKMIVANERGVQGDLSFFKGIELLIITIPPKLDKNGNINYDLIIDQLIKKIVFFRIKKVIYTSSTSVYGFQKKTISEKSEKYPLSDAAKKIIICENKLIENPYFETCIIRLGGLIGPDRHPIFKLSGKKNIPNPKSPINLIHQKDAVGITLYLSENWNGNEIFNAVTPFQPTRKEYYKSISKIAKVEPPKFEVNGKIRGKISSSKLLKFTNYRFKVENLLILN